VLSLSFSPAGSLVTFDFLGMDELGCIATIGTSVSDSFRLVIGMALALPEYGANGAFSFLLVCTWGVVLEGV
jgi:hypothetical protein